MPCIYLWLCFCLCLLVWVRVCFCFFSVPLCDQMLKMESLFEALSVFSGWYCPAFSMDVKCTSQYIRWRQWQKCLSISRCVLVCLCKRKMRQWGEMTSVIRFVCSSFVFCSSVGQWITVCVCAFLCLVQYASTCSLSWTQKCIKPCLKAKTDWRSGDPNQLSTCSEKHLVKKCFVNPFIVASQAEITLSTQIQAESTWRKQRKASDCSHSSLLFKNALSN